MCKTIKQRVKFNAPPQTIYALLADSRKHSALTGRKASISRRIGGKFSTNSGGVTGINVDLEGIFSMATFNRAPTPNGGTALVLTHRGVPKELIPGIEQGWRDRYWNRMKAYVAAAAKQQATHRGG